MLSTPARSNFGLALALATSITFVATANAAPVIVAGVSEGVTTDLFDVAQGAKVVGAISTPSPIFEYERALGKTGVGGETTHSIFANASENTVQSFTLRTPAPVNLTSYDLILQQDNPGGPRSAKITRVYASNDGINFTEISDSSDTIASLSNYNTNFGSNGITVSEAVNTTAQFFRVESTTGAFGSTRVNEFDAAPSSTIVPLIIDPIIFNATTNSGGDEAPGLSFNFTVSSSVFGADDPEDAFGNNDGAVEPNSFIFADGGVADNGNGIMGDGGETVDFIEWETTSLIELAGYQLDVTGDGVDATTRGTDLVRFLVDSVEVDLFDNNHLTGPIDRLFVDGPVTGDTFRIEFTRTIGGSNSGPRVREINAILAPPAPPAVPEPGSLAILSMLGVAMLHYRRRGIRN